MLRRLIILSFVILLCGVFIFSVRQKVADHSFQESSVALSSEQSPVARSTSVIPRSNESQTFPFAPLDADSKWLQEARLQDVKRSANEDSRMLANVLGLSEDQRAQLSGKLEQFRLATETSEVTEYDIVTSGLSPKQQDLYEKYLVQKRRADAEQFASIRMGSIERITGPLSEAQRDEIYQGIAANLVSGKIVSDAEILKHALNESQFTLWSQSSDAEPVNIGN